MLKPTTHFEQIPLEKIIEIVKKETLEQAVEVESRRNIKKEVLIAVEISDAVAERKLQ